MNDCIGSCTDGCAICGVLTDRLRFAALHRRCEMMKSLYMKYQLGQMNAERVYGKHKSVKTWLSTHKEERKKADTLRTAYYNKLLQEAEDDEAAALHILSSGAPPPEPETPESQSDDDTDMWVKVDREAMGLKSYWWHKKTRNTEWYNPEEVPSSPSSPEPKPDDPADKKSKPNRRRGRGHPQTEEERTMFGSDSDESNNDSTEDEDPLTIKIEKQFGTWFRAHWGQVLEAAANWYGHALILFSQLCFIQHSIQLLVQHAV